MLTGLIKDITKIDKDDILACWRWRMQDVKDVLVVSCIGDLFVTGSDNCVYWIETGVGTITKIADDNKHFETLLAHEDNIDEWFLPLLVEKLIQSGKKLKEDQVYSFKKFPVLGGDYEPDNFDCVNISVHFAFSGQICEQIKDLPDGTAVEIKVKEN